MKRVPGCIEALLVLAGWLLGARALAADDPDVPRLLTRVTVEAAAYTLAEAAEALSKQTGLRIEPEPYLRERLVVVSLRQTPARDALVALCEANGWAWRRVEQGVYRIGRRAPAGSGLKGVALRYQAAIPLDLRLLAGFERSSVTAAEAAREGGPNSLVSFGRLGVHKGLIQAVQADLAALGRSLGDRIAAGGTIPVRELDERQLRWTLLAVVAYHLGRTPEQLPRGEVYPYEADLRLLGIRLKGNLLEFGTEGPDGTFAGFGGPVPGLPEPGPPSQRDR